MRNSIFVLALTLAAAFAARADDAPGVLVKDPLPGTAEYVVQKVFLVTQLDDFRGFYGDLCHRDTCKLTDVAMAAYKDGQWAKFKARYEQCLVDADTLTYRYRKTIPRTIKDSTSRVTFVFGEGKKGGRMLLRRNEDGEWRIFKLSE